MRWIVRGLPAISLLATAAFLAVAGFVLLAYALIGGAITGNGAGNVPGIAAIGAALLLGGAALVWLARGVWRLRRWAIHVALGFSLAVIAYLAWVAPGAFTSHASALNPATGRVELQYDMGAELIVLAMVPYAIVVACLVVLELRQRGITQESQR